MYIHIYEYICVCIHIFSASEGAHSASFYHYIFFIKGFPNVIIEVDLLYFRDAKC